MSRVRNSHRFYRTVSRTGVPRRTCSSPLKTAEIRNWQVWNMLTLLTLLHHLKCWNFLSLPLLWFAITISIVNVSSHWVFQIWYITPRTQSISRSPNSFLLSLLSYLLSFIFLLFLVFLFLVVIDGKKKGSIQSPTLCKAFTSVYLE